MDWDNAYKGDKESTTKLTTSILISLNDNNQRLIVLIYNSVFYTKIKYIDIYNDFIYNMFIAQRIKLPYVSTGKIITNGRIKTITYIKFYKLTAQIKMTSKKIV